MYQFIPNSLRHCLRAIAVLLCVLLSTQASALSLGPDEFASAKRLTCVLAQDSLGYLGEGDYEHMIDDVLDDYEPAEGDVVYAKALGYFDGLMFGLPAGDSSQINARLQEFLGSQACTQLVGVSFYL